MSPRYHMPRSVSEAVEILSSVPGALPIAGGTDIMVRMRPGVPGGGQDVPPALVSLRHIPELAAIEESDPGGALRIGAAVPLREVADNPTVKATLPALVEAIEVFGSPQIRNVATLGGNLGNASPAADSVPPLIAYGARVEITGPDSTRRVPVEEFLTGPGRTALAPGEIVTAVTVGPRPTGERSTYLRQGRVRMDVALVGLATRLATDGVTCVDIRLAAGAVGPTPLRLTAAESLLRGSRLDPDTVARAAARAEAEVSPITDIRASEGYRRHLIGVFLRRSIARLTDPVSPQGGSS